MHITDKIKVRYSYCGKEFKERGTKIRGGSKIPCSNCHQTITFDTASPDAAIRKALASHDKHAEKHLGLKPLPKSD